MRVLKKTAIVYACQEALGGPCRLQILPARLMDTQKPVDEGYSGPMIWELRALNAAWDRYAGTTK